LYRSPTGFVSHPVPPTGGDEFKDIMASMKVAHGSAGYTNTVGGSVLGGKREHVALVKTAFFQFTNYIRSYYLHRFAAKPPTLNEALDDFFKALGNHPHLMPVYLTYLLLKREVRDPESDQNKIRALWQTGFFNVLIGRLYKKRNHLATYVAFQYGYTHGLSLKEGGVMALINHLFTCYGDDPDALVSHLTRLLGDGVDVVDVMKSKMQEMMYGLDSDFKKWDTRVTPIETTLYNFFHWCSYAVNPAALTVDDYVMMAWFLTDEFASNFKVICTGDREIPHVSVLRLLASGMHDTANLGSVVHRRKDLSHKMEVSRVVRSLIPKMREASPRMADNAEDFLRLSWTVYHHSDDELAGCLRSFLGFVELVSKTRWYATAEAIQVKDQAIDPKTAVRLGAAHELLASIAGIETESLPVDYEFEDIVFTDYSYYDRIRRWRPILSTMNSDTEELVQVGCSFLKNYFVWHRGSVMPYRIPKEIVMKAYKTTNAIRSPLHYLEILSGLIRLTPVTPKCYGYLRAVYDSICGGQNIVVMGDSGSSLKEKASYFRKIGMRDEYCALPGSIPDHEEVIVHYIPSTDFLERYASKYTNPYLHQGCSFYQALSFESSLDSDRYAKHINYLIDFYCERLINPR
jgi:hypothetical protein